MSASGFDETEAGSTALDVWCNTMLEAVLKADRHDHLLVAGSRGQRVDTRIECRNSIAAAHALIDAFKVHISSRREQVVGLRHDLVPVRKGVAGRRVERGHRVRIGRTEAQVRLQEVTAVDLEVIEFDVVAVAVRWTGERPVARAAAEPEARRAFGGRMGPEKANG